MATLATRSTQVVTFTRTDDGTAVALRAAMHHPLASTRFASHGAVSPSSTPHGVMLHLSAAHSLTPPSSAPRCVMPPPSMAQSFFARWVAQREWESHRFELVEGRIVRRPPVGAAIMALTRRLHRRVAQAAAGTGMVVLEPRQGFELPTGDTLTPDVVALSAARWADAQPSAGDLLRVVPELVIEIVRAPGLHGARNETRACYERAGVLEHWVVDPVARTIWVRARRSDRLDLGRVLAGDALHRSCVVPALRLGPALVL